MSSEADTDPAPPPDLEMRVSALEARADQADARVGSLEQEFDELEKFLDAKIELLRTSIEEWFRRRREGVTNGGGEMR